MVLSFVKEAINNAETSDVERIKLVKLDGNEVIADLHIHSRFSRATSKNLTLPNLVKWARVKGINLLGTGDFTHPKWIEEVRSSLVEKNGFYWFKDDVGEFPFVLSGEISLIYTDKGRGRKVHLVMLAPSLEVVDKINSYLDENKFRRDYDGRPIFGMSCEKFVKIISDISNEVEIIPAHCLLPNAFIHLKNEVKEIKDIKKGEEVLTHCGKFRKVKEILINDYSGKVLKIIPWYFREGLETTPEHPFFAIKSFKNCPSIKGLCKPLCSSKNVYRKKHFLNYTKQWIQAKDLEKGDFLVYPRLREEKDINKLLLEDYVSNFKILDKDYLIPGFARNHTGKIKRAIRVDERFCRLLGYFLSEGYLITDTAIGFSFNSKEKEYIQDVTSIIRDYFGFEITKMDRRRENQSDLIFNSKLLNSFFSNFYHTSEKRAHNKYLPVQFLNLSNKKIAEIFRGWWRGDTGNTVSKQLANQMKTLCLKLGIIPSISTYSAEQHSAYKHFVGDRQIIAKHDLIVFSNLSFFEDDFGMLKEPCFRKFVNGLNRKHGWVDKDNIYLPIRTIEKRDYSGEIYNLEVEEDNSYVAEFACVHNCWTPFFGVFGSEGGYDSLLDAFGEQVNKIHAIETGISSDPEMNWKLKELSNKAIISFSDAHSFWPWRLGREATIFNGAMKTFSYSELIKQIRNNGFKATIETEPAYGKYHFDGHRDCKFSCSPNKTQELNGMCPNCHKPLVIGVDNRVEKLGDFRGIPLNAKPFFKILPLHELIAFFIKSKVENKKTWAIYDKLIEKFGNEFNILLKVDRNVLVSELAKDKMEKLADLIIDNRIANLKVEPGYDGVYGKLVDKDVVKQKTLV